MRRLRGRAARLVASRGDRLLRLSWVPRSTTHLIVEMGDGVRRTVCGERADGLPVVAAVNVTCAECWRIARAVEGTVPPPSIAGLRVISDSDLDETALGHGLQVSDAARGYDAAAMIHVTDQLTQLHDTAVARATKRVVNRGANPVDVSTDPALVFGQGLTIAAAGGEDTVELQEGERLFGICGAGLATDVVIV